MTNIRKIAICTGGGDAPGLNAVIRAAVLAALNRGLEVYGSRRAYSGFLGEDDFVCTMGECEKGTAEKPSQAAG